MASATFEEHPTDPDKMIMRKPHLDIEGPLHVVCRCPACKQAQQEPVGWIDSKGNMICTKINESCKPLYTHPQLKAEKQEPVAWMSEDEHEVYTSKQVDGYFQHDHIPLYTTPQQRTWVGLTDEEMLECNMDGDIMIDRETAKRNVEAKLKEKNT